MEEFLKFAQTVNVYNFPLLMFLVKTVAVVLLLLAVALFIYDRYVQRRNQLLINYPLIGRLRYFFYLLRDPMRQYFGDEKFYESFDKVRWVYDAAEGRALLASFSPGQPVKGGRVGLKNASRVLNREEVDPTMQVTFGSGIAHPFTARSVIGRSAMSDGSISPEGTRAFAKGAYLGGFPINTGEGGLTSNFLYTHRYDPKNEAWLQTHRGTFFARGLYRACSFFFNKSLAEKLYRHLVLPPKVSDTYLFDKTYMTCFRVNWQASLEQMPTEVPEDLPDIILQIGSGLYGVRDGSGVFDEERYQKVMRFCRMSEIKLAQGAKQTGGKLLADKVSDAIAYYRGVEPHKDLFSPNRFPYYGSVEELFDFIGRLKRLSGKPVGIKIVLSDAADFDPFVDRIKEAVKNGSQAYPDFISLDGGNGGTGAAPLEMMMTVGLPIRESVVIADDTLKKAGVRKNVKLIASEKVLTPDDAVVLKALGADFVAIARGFMMSAGCIRARECSGAHGRHCPVGLATQDARKRASFLVEQKARHVALYHQRLKEGIVGLLAIMGKSGIDHLTREDLQYNEKI